MDWLEVESLLWWIYVNAGQLIPHWSHWPPHWSVSNHEYYPDCFVSSAPPPISNGSDTLLGVVEKMLLLRHAKTHQAASPMQRSTEWITLKLKLPWNTNSQLSPVVQWHVVQCPTTPHLSGTPGWFPWGLQSQPREDATASECCHVAAEKGTPLSYKIVQTLLGLFPLPASLSVESPATWWSL